MDLEEAKRIVNITDEEKNSIRTYLGFSHTSINILANLTPETYGTLSKNWYLQQDATELKSDIEDFVNIYSAMYKYSKQNTITDFLGKYDTLTRGMSNKRMKDVSTQENQFISTSLDPNVAVRFCHYNDAAIEHIELGENVPFLYAGDFMKEDNEDEKEIIIAPFTKVTVKGDKWNSRGEYTHYNVSVNARELTTLSPSETEKAGRDIEEGFSANLEDIKEYNSTMDRYESFCRQQRFARRDEVKYFEEELAKLEGKLDLLKTRTSNFSSKLQSYLQSRCAEKVKEYEQAKEMVEVDKKFQEEQAKKQAEEAKRKSEIESLNGRISAVPNATANMILNITSTYNQMAKEENEMMQTYRLLGLNYVPRLNAERVRSTIKLINLNVGEISGKLNSARMDGEASIEAVEQSLQYADPYLKGIANSRIIAKNTQNLVGKNEVQSESELKRALYLKVSEVIKSAKLQKLQTERKEIEGERIGIIGRIMGKQDLKDERLAQNALKTKIVQASIPKEQNKYSIRDMLAEMYVCAMTEFDGNLTTEMQDLYSRITDVFSYTDNNGNVRKFSEEYIKGIAKDKIMDQTVSVPVVVNGPKRFGTKAKVEQVKAENYKLQERLQTIQKLGTVSRFKSYGGPDTVTEFEQELQRIEIITRSLATEKTKDEKKQDDIQY